MLIQTTWASQAIDNFLHGSWLINNLQFTVENEIQDSTSKHKTPVL